MSTAVTEWKPLWAVYCLTCFQVVAAAERVDDGGYRFSVPAPPPSRRWCGRDNSGHWGPFQVRMAEEVPQ